MKRITTLVILLLLTLLAGFASNLKLPSGGIALVIMGLATTKLLLVAFQFMELRKAHIFWKSSLVIFSITFSLAVCALLVR